MNLISISSQNLNKMKKKSLFNLTFVCLCFLFNGCNSPKPTFQDFIGTWVSEDGGEIILRSDSTCVCVCVKTYAIIILIYFQIKNHSIMKENGF